MPEKSAETTRERPTPKSRIFSVTMLVGVIGAVGWLGEAVYRIATDGFVAPCVLSPDSDMVIQSKLSMAQLTAERFRVTSRREEIDVTVEAADHAILELEELRAQASRGLDYTSTLTAKQAAAGSSDLSALAKQRSDLAAMIAGQEAFAAEVQKDVDAGLATKAEYSREKQTLNQMRLALIENDRSRLVTEVTMSQVTLTQQALAKSHAPGHLATPEMLMLQDQLVRVSTDILKLRAERRAATSEKGHLDEELTMIGELMEQLKARPTFAAATAAVNVAFVPYTQMDGVASGAVVYDCVLGLVHCKPVGHIKNLLPGEVILPDPWGTPTRGQYATMDLADAQAAKSKILRVRPGRAAEGHAAEHASAVVAPNDRRLANAK